MTTPAVHFRVHFGLHAIGPGKIELLEHIGSSGSLSQAARELRMSYRRAWQLLESVNDSFRERAVLTARGGRGGGGAQVTPFGRLLVRAYRDFDAELQQRAIRSFASVLPLARRGAVRRRGSGRQGAGGRPTRLSRR